MKISTRFFVIVALGVMLALPGNGRDATPHRVALIVGISAYDLSTEVPQLPQCETSARAIANALDGQAETTLKVRRVTRDDLLDAVRKVGLRCTADDFFLLMVVCASDRDGLLASDGYLSPRQVHQAFDATSARQRAFCLDGACGGVMVDEVGNGDAAALASTSGDDRAWSAFFPLHDFTRLESAASHGWRRALERGAASSWEGDRGNKGSLSFEDLRMCGDEDAMHAVPDEDESRTLDAELGMRVLSAVRPSAARRLRSSDSVKIDDLRHALGEARFVQLAGVLDCLSGDAFRTVDAGVRNTLLAALHDRPPVAALQALHNEMLRRNLLDTPTDASIRRWKRLVLSDSQSETVALVTPATERSSVRGRADLAVFGPRRQCVYPVPYGRYAGDVSGRVRARLRMELSGTYVSGHWEGELDGRWLRGEWQGALDPVHGSISGRMACRLQSEAVSEKPPNESMWPVTFEGKTSEDGTVLSGSFRSADPRQRVDGQWRVTK